MIVYRNCSYDASIEAELGRLERLVARGDVADLLVELGAFEQGVVDTLSPETDTWNVVTSTLRHASLAAGRALVDACAGRCDDLHRRSTSCALSILRRLPLPQRISIRSPEGYVHYALQPLGFVEAARDYRATVGPLCAQRAIVVGVRSIGTSLSATVAAVLGASQSVTVRPRGGLGERHVCADTLIEAQVVDWLSAGGDALVVDEGPGVTGETFAATVAWLRSLGVPENRIVLFPTRTSGMELAPAERREWFARARKHLPLLDDSRPARLAARIGAGTAMANLCDGRWRGIVPRAAREVANPTHERRKFLARDEVGHAYLIRYAGLGRWGDTTLSRARALANAGIGAVPVDHAGGYLALAWTDGRVCRASDGRDPSFVEALRLYLATRTRLFRTGCSVILEPIVEMLTCNTREAFTREPPGLNAAARRLEALPDRESVIPDARMCPREWLRNARGYHKTDALDHGDGMRLPGPTDLAWDLAAASVEFALGTSAMQCLIDSCAHAAVQSPAVLTAAVRAYRAPYAAACLGDAVLSTAEALTPADRHLLEAAAATYQTVLRRELACAGA